MFTKKYDENMKQMKIEKVYIIPIARNYKYLPKLQFKWILVKKKIWTLPILKQLKIY